MDKKPKLKKATNMREAYRVFEGRLPLTPDEKYLYVNIYDKDISKLQKDLIFNEIPNKSFFVTGQSGNGKSTALNFLANSEINKQYQIKHINGREVFNLEDIDAIDVIIMVGLEIVKGDEELEKKFLGELEELRKIKMGKLEKHSQEIDKNHNVAEAELSLGVKIPFLSFLNFGAGFQEKYKLQKETRSSVRELFTLDKSELIEKTNNIIAELRRRDTNAGKDLLLIMDDLEKIDNYDQAKKLFDDNRYVFEKLNCVKIVTFPAYLATKRAVEQSSKFGARITKNPKASGYNESDDAVSESNREKLKSLILKRLDNTELASPKAIEKAVELSGGNPRSLLTIMQKAARNAVNMDDNNQSEEVITELEVEEAAKDISEMASLAAMRRIKALDYVMKNYQEPTDESLLEDFAGLIRDNSVLAYFNGHPWYDINPLIKESVSEYAKVLPENENKVLPENK